MKRLCCFFLILFGVVFCGCSAENSSNVTSLMFSRTADVDLEVGEYDAGGYLLVSVRKRSDFTLEDIDFISEDESVAAIECISNTMNTYLYYRITALSVGQTYVYARSADGTVSSEKIKVTVTDGSRSLSPTGESSLSFSETPQPPSDSRAEQGSRFESRVPETLSLVSLTDPVKRGEQASLSVCGAPETLYTIKVYYSSTVSKAAGLEEQVSDASGNVTWTWRVGSSVKAGEYKITVEGGGEILTVYFTVIEKAS